MVHENLSAQEVIEKLKEGNGRYLTVGKTPAARKKMCDEGQRPHAIVITCSDSRVIPENIFMARAGELFVVRVAGNVMDNHQLGSVEYAAEHLGCNLVVILGHTHCGAVRAALRGGTRGFVKYITDEILEAVGVEKDELKACHLNVERSVARIREALEELPGLTVCGAIYHMEHGHVEFLEA